MRPVGCIYLGGGEISGLSPGKFCNLALDENGIAVLPLRPVFTSQRPPLMHLPWSVVLDAQVTDAAEQRLQTRVRQRRYGGILAPVFKTMPVAEQKTKRVARSYLEITTEQGAFLFDLPGQDAMKLKGRLLTTKPQWGTPEPSSS